MLFSNLDNCVDLLILKLQENFNLIHSELNSEATEWKMQFIVLIYQKMDPWKLDLYSRHFWIDRLVFLFYLKKNLHIFYARSCILFAKNLMLSLKVVCHMNFVFTK